MDIWSLTDLATPWCVHVVATLRIAQRIASGTTRIEELASSSGADRDSLWRVMRHLVSQGVFEEPARGEFALNEPAQFLADDAACVGLDLNGIGGRMAHSWSTLFSAVRTG